MWWGPQSFFNSYSDKAMNVTALKLSCRVKWNSTDFTWFHKRAPICHLIIAMKNLIEIPRETWFHISCNLLHGTASAPQSKNAVSTLPANDKRKLLILLEYCPILPFVMGGQCRYCIFTWGGGRLSDAWYVCQALSIHAPRYLENFNIFV